MTKMRVPVFLLLCWGCLGLLIYESYAFVHRTAPLQWFTALHGCTALALGMVAAYTLYERLHQSGAQSVVWPVGLIVVAGLDVGMQWYQGSDYLLSSLLQPFHVLAIALLIWRMTTIADKPTASYGEALLTHGAALIGVWGVAATWSPLVVVYADQYSGGDTLVGQGVTCLLAFVVSLVLTARRTIHTNVQHGVMLGVLFGIGVSQAVVSDSWRFLPLLLVTGLCFEGIRMWRPQAKRLSLIVCAAIWLLGYFATLHRTSIIAWDTTTWVGLCVLGICLAGVLSAVRMRPQEERR